MSVFESIYSWFDSLFGESLAMHMAGYNPVDGQYSNPNLFNVCGIIAIISVVLICILFYYLWDPAYGKRWKWFLMLGAVAVINFTVGWAIPYTDLHNENIGVIEGMSSVTDLDCVMFGLSDFIVSACFFIILSYVIRWWSSGNKYIPF